MARDFTSVTYETNKAVSVLVRLEAKSIAAFPGAAGEADLDIHAYVGSGRRRNGIHCRGVRLTKVGADPTLKDFSTFLAVPVKATWDGLAIGGTVTGYAGYKISKLVEEQRV